MTSTCILKFQKFIALSNYIIPCSHLILVPSELTKINHNQTHNPFLQTSVGLQDITLKTLKQSNIMLNLIIVVIVAIIIGVVLVLYTNVRQTLYDPEYFQITILLGSGGHTGQISKLFKGFHFKKTNKINILITETDKSSLNFFTNSLKNSFGQDYNILESKLHIHYVKRTNQVKQSYVTALFSGIRALFSSILLVFNNLCNTTHFISNGPGTCVPFFYLFFALKSINLSRVKLIFIESWCRVKDLSLSGKLVKPVVDEFIVHWPELAIKYKKCKYYGKII